MSNIVPSYERFESDGLELVVNTSTGIAYASVSATARMLNLEPIQVKRALEKRGIDYAAINAEIPTVSGKKTGTNLLESTTIFDLAIEYCPELAKKMGAAGANLYMLKLAGYKMTVAEADPLPTLEDDRRHLELTIAPTPKLSQIKQAAKIYKEAFGEAYYQRYVQQQMQKHYPALSGSSLDRSESASLPTTRALLTPTKIAEELNILYKTGSGNGSKINTLLKELGYQDMIGGRWSATNKAIEANLVDRKPVDTNSRTQKDQLLWSADIIAILQEHLVAH